MGQVSQLIQLAVPTSVAAGAAVAIGNRQLNLATLAINGTFSQTLRLQGSVDGGLTFQDWMDSRGLLIGNIVSPGGVVLLGGDATHVRLNCTVYVSGQAVVAILFAPQYARADRLVV